MELPARCDRYELVEYLGGGMSEVYRARDTVINRTVAVKMLRAESAADQESRARFLREAKVAGNIDHDNIIHIYDFGEANGRPFMVMEFLHGGDLRAAMNAGELGDFDYRVRIVLGIARAFEHIHTLGIIHRDIKPENINIDSLGKVKLMDFGIAKSKDLNITRSGFTLGTPSYMAPEQVMGQEVSPSVDIYAFGILLYEIFTGVKPIRGGDVVEVFRKILQEPIDYTPLEQAGLNPRLVALVRRLTEKKPQDRLGSFTEIIEELESIRPGMAAAAPMEAVAPAPEAQFKTLPKRWMMPAAVAATVVVLVGLFFVFHGDHGPRPAAPEKAEGMVLVPAGAFPFGPSGEGVMLPAYWIDRTEVSVAAYAEFASETGRAAPAGAPDSPVTGVTIDGARAFAAWAGKRLPTAREWEKAASGADGLAYPWGDEADPARANVAGNAATAGRLMPVDSLPAGASPYGALHMVGNVAELVLEFSDPSPADVERFELLLSPPPTASESWCVTRGGSADHPMPENAAQWAEPVPARYSSDYLGFRCVKDRVRE